MAKSKLGVPKMLAYKASTGFCKQFCYLYHEGKARECNEARKNALKGEKHLCILLDKLEFKAQ